MASIRKTMTEAAQAANQSNGRQSSGPVSAEGKEQSKMNALRHGKYARRPDPVKLLLAGGYGSGYGTGAGRRSGREAEEVATAEEAERDRLRAEMVRCYAPRDDFARLQAEELADLKFELARLERVKEVVWRRERELLEMEQRRRRLVAQGGGGIATSDWDVERHGYIRLPDSPAKFVSMRSELGYIMRQAGQEQISMKAVQNSVAYLYGCERPTFCGRRVRGAADALEQAGADPKAQEQARGNLKAAAASQLDRVDEQLAVCLMDEGPLSEAGQAARLLEATSSRKWGWLRSQENFLRRSIDRKVGVLIDLRSEDTREALAATRTARLPDEPGTPPSTRNGPASPNGVSGPACGSTSSPASGETSGAAPAEPAAGLPPGRGEAPAPEPPASDQVSAQSAEPEVAVDSAGRGVGRCDKNRCPNRGTNPPCALESTNRIRRGSHKCGNRGLNSTARRPMPMGLGAPGHRRKPGEGLRRPINVGAARSEREAARDLSSV